MSTYKNIIGKDVNFLSTDPDNAAAEGQIWYNSTDNAFKDVLISSAWISGATMGTTRRAMNSGFGAKTAGVAVGGYTTTFLNATEEYNGTGWSTSGNYPASLYYIASAGAETAGVAAGGGDPVSSVVCEYNGSTWTAVTSIPTAARGMMRAGTQTAALFGGGFQPSATGVCFEYDGTNWTGGGTMNTARGFAGCSGAQTDAVFFGGGSVANTEEYNGTAWSEQTDLPSARAAVGFANDTTSSSAMSAGGVTPAPARITTCDTYDGSSWSSIPALSTAREQAASGAGTSEGTYVAGGTTSGPAINTTEEYNRSVNVITAGAFASSPALSYSVDANLASAGSLTSAVAAGGYNAPAGPGTVSYIAKAATWNGTAWSNITDMPERRTNNNAVGATAPAFYVFGGQNMPGPSTNSYLTTTHTWNGSSWGSGPALAESQSGGGAAGTPSAIVLVGGVNAPSSGSIDDNIQQYNGSSWANSPVNYPTNISGNGCVGTQTAAVIFGGHAGGSPFPSSGVATTNEWNGSSISSANNMVFGILGCSGSGTQTAALSYGGRNTAGNKNGIGMIYDGTSWATQPSLAVARDYIAMGPMGSSTNCLAVAGSGGAQSLVEEFTGETSALNIKTITTS